MPENHTKGEMHGCVVCGRLHELYVVYDPTGRFIDMKVMSGDGKGVPFPGRPLVACSSHGEEQVRRAVERVFGTTGLEEEQ